jgi:spore maturation protein A
MMSYIWAGLIVSALGFALWADFGDWRADRYRNANPFDVELRLERPFESASGPADVTVAFPSDGSTGPVKARLFPGTAGQVELRFPAGARLPEPLPLVRDVQAFDDRELRARVAAPPAGATAFTSTLTYPPVRFVKLRAISTAAIEFSKTAVTLALGFIGVFALWMGLMKIAEASGLIDVFVVLVQPFLRFLFPEVPRGHPALGMIAMNLAANMLGLGNAATPMGLKAMEELQKLNPTDDTATDPMVMLLAVNTAGVQLLPSATLVAIMGMQSLAVFVPILIATGISLVAAIVAARLLGRLPVFRRTNPNGAGLAAGGGAKEVRS